MSLRAALRPWATPLTMGAFVLMSGTGVLMFFEVDRGLTAVIHQWFSWLFLLGAAAHVMLNIHSLKNHLRSRWGIASIVAFATILVVSFSSWGMITGPQLERPVEEALVDAPLSALASVARIDSDVLLRRFNDHGIVATAEETIRHLSESRNLDENHLLGLIFLSK